MDNISILSKLSMIQDTCTKKEVKIANYICKNVRNIRNLKIDNLSKATGIGFSPIYSLIKKLGFTSYRDFIIAIIAEQERLETNNLNLDGTENVFLYYQDILQRNQQLFDDVKFYETVTLLKNAKTIYLAGLGNSALAVRELANRLVNFGFTCSLLVENGNNIITQASLLQSSDLLICISLQGKTSVIIGAAKEAKNNGVNVIGITSKYNSDLSKYADITHNIVSATLHEKNNIFVSVLLPLIYWNDNLIKVLLSFDKEHHYLENKVKSSKILKKYC